MERDFLRKTGHSGKPEVVSANYRQTGDGGYQATVILAEPDGNLQFKTGLSFTEEGAKRALESLNPKSSTDVGKV